MGKLTLTVFSLLVLSFSSNYSRAEGGDVPPPYPPPQPVLTQTFIYDCSDIGWLRTSWVNYWGRTRYKDVYVGKGCEAQRATLMQLRQSISKVSYFAICSAYQWQDRFTVDAWGNFEEKPADRYYSKMDQCVKEAAEILKN